MTSIAVIVGNPNPGGRTTRAGRAVAAAIASDGDTTTTYELAEIAPKLFEWGNADVAELTAAVAATDVLVVACPTYKATFTGLLKAFLDNYGNDGLAGCAAIPVMVGAAPQHALAPEVHLRPLLVELGASVPTRALYILEDDMDALDSIVAAWAETARPLLV